MKIRKDFVTNSSSSSFILAKKDGLTERQKQEIIKFVESNMLGNKKLGPESTVEEIQKFFDDTYLRDDEVEEINQALKEGKSIYSGWVSFDECEYHHTKLYQDIWEALKKDEEHFKIINGDLDY